MYTVQGMIRKNIVNVQSQFEKLGHISSNVSNMNTNGYKAVRFDQLLDEDGYLDGYIRRDFSGCGSTLRTENILDVALTSPGFIPVTSPTGDVTYTRDGRFKLDKEGYLITSDGYLVGEGIQIPANYDSLRIKEDGSIFIQQEGKSQPIKIGKIPVVQFANAEGLKPTDGNKLIATQESGEPMLDKENKSFVQGAVELSNVDLHAEVYNILRLNTSVKASFAMMRIVDDMYNKSINLRQ